LIKVSDIKKIILDALFPIKCINCSQNGFWICPECEKKIIINHFQVCPQCEKIITKSGTLCQTCRRKDRSLDGLIAATTYQTENISRLVHFFKYNFIDSLSTLLGEIMLKGFISSEAPIPDLIVPVPLSSRRLRWRGYNQSALLAQYLSNNIAPGLAVDISENLLKRIRTTWPQMTIKNYRDRKENIQGVFAVSESAGSIKNKSILLVDDIATTGATLFECAKALKESGAKKVFGIVIARQTIKNQLV